MRKRQVPAFIVALVAALAICGHRAVFADEPPIRLQIFAGDVSGVPLSFPELAPNKTVEMTLTMPEYRVGQIGSPAAGDVVAKVP